MKPAIRYRKSIPLFYDKSESEFKEDTYERFDSMVFRQSILHLADVLWNGYPMQEVLDLVTTHLATAKIDTILELGCGTGRLIATLAQAHPKMDCWGIDYSYQMLKRAQEFWCEEATIYLDVTKIGFKNTLELKGHRLSNLSFGLAKAANLPFDDASQGAVVHSFLFDRVGDPRKVMEEIHRVLIPGGLMYFVTPLNFHNKAHWTLFHPAIKIYEMLKELNFEVEDWLEDLEIFEPLDIRGSGVRWKCIAVKAYKERKKG